MILFETPRLIVRTFVMDDAQDVLEWMGDPEVARYEYWEPFTLDSVLQYLAPLVSRVPGSPNVWSEYALVLEVDGKLGGKPGRKAIGSVSIKPTDTPMREAEIGFKVNRLYQRRGFATEAVRALLEHAFSTGISRVFAVVDTRNSACVALLERIGMTRERHIERSCFVKGEWSDEYIYATEGVPPGPPGSTSARMETQRVADEQTNAEQAADERAAAEKARPRCSDT